MSFAGPASTQSEGAPPAQGKAGRREGSSGCRGSQVSSGETQASDREGKDAALLPERQNQVVPREFKISTFLPWKTEEKWMN